MDLNAYRNLSGAFLKMIGMTGSWKTSGLMLKAHGTMRTTALVVLALLAVAQVSEATHIKEVRAACVNSSVN